VDLLVNMLYNKLRKKSATRHDVEFRFNRSKSRRRSGRRRSSSSSSGGCGGMS